MMSQLNKEKLQTAITSFQQKISENPEEYQKIFLERTDRVQYYQLYTAEKSSR